MQQTIDQVENVDLSQPTQISEICGLDEKDHVWTPRTWAAMQLHFLCLRKHRAWCFLNAAARKWKDIRGRMRSENHPRPKTSMTKSMQYQTNDSTDDTQGACVCLSYMPIGPDIVFNKPSLVSAKEPLTPTNKTRTTVYIHPMVLDVEWLPAKTSPKHTPRLKA